jgi:integrase
LKRAGVDEEAAKVKVRTWRKRERAASAEELGRVLRTTRDLVDEGAIWPWAGYLVLLLILTGARPSEVRTAKWSDVDLAKGVLTRREHKTADKTGEVRTIHLPLEAITLLERMPRINGNPYLIPGKVRGEPLRIYDKLWRAIQERAGVEGLWVYDLRRTWASMALGSGASREQIARALGHSDLSAVSGYAWLLPGARAEIAGRVGSLVARLDGPTTPPAPDGDREQSGPA